MIYLPCWMCRTDLCIDLIHIVVDHYLWNLIFFTPQCPCGAGPSHASWDWTMYFRTLPRFLGPFAVYNAWQEGRYDRVENYLPCFEWSDPDMIRDALLSAGVSKEVFVQVPQGEAR